MEFPSNTLSTQRSLGSQSSPNNVVEISSVHSTRMEIEDQPNLEIVSEDISYPDTQQRRSSRIKEKSRERS
jgi:hypothetical protein